MSVGIGSSFASSTRNEPPADLPLPWAIDDDAVYVQSGRQALTLLSELLWSDGRRRLVLPGFLCESMIEPFGSRDWSIRFSPTDDRLRPDAGSYGELSLDHAEETVVLIAEYFGRSLDAEAQSAVERWDKAGVTVIEDRTHNLFDDTASTATYTFGSLRKLLPVGDGCFVHGLDHSPQLDPPDVDPSVPSWTSMDLKAEGQVSGGPARQQYERAEVEFGVATRPAAISPRSLGELTYLDYPAMSAARRSNFDTLIDLIPDLPVLNDDCAGGTPAFLVMQTANPRDLQGVLAERGIFCPIHWPRPRQVPRDVPWREDLISIPIDHRYGREDMEYIGQTLTDVAVRRG